MRILLTVLIFGFLLFPSLSFSHSSGHSQSYDPITSETAEKKAREFVAFSILEKRLDTSWSKVSDVRTEKKTINENPEWIVIFKNDKVNDKKKQTLYIFFDLYGNFLGANFTGT